MNKLVKVFQDIIGAETNLVPIFIHNPQSQAIAAVVMVAEELVIDLLQELGSAQQVAKPASIPAKQ